MNVLRMGGDEITHVYFTTIEGQKNYLTKEDHNKMLALSSEDIGKYYSGEDHDEVISLKEDISDLVTGEVSIEQIKLRIALQTGLINEMHIIKLN